VNSQYVVTHRPVTLFVLFRRPVRSVGHAVPPTLVHWVSTRGLPDRSTLLEASNTAPPAKDELAAAAVVHGSDMVGEKETVMAGGLHAEEQEATDSRPRSTKLAPESCDTRTVCWSRRVSEAPGRREALAVI
jgi:hypothetical protein